MNENKIIIIIETVKNQNHHHHYFHCTINFLIFFSSHFNRKRKISLPYENQLIQRTIVYENKFDTKPIDQSDNLPNRKK